MLELSKHIQANLVAAKNTNCGRVGHIFTKALDKHIVKLNKKARKKSTAGAK